jgi:hypothetical protein
MARQQPRANLNHNFYSFSSVAQNLRSAGPGGSPAPGEPATPAKDASSNKQTGD